jgi:hypothetical protein
MSGNKLPRKIYGPKKMKYYTTRNTVTGKYNMRAMKHDSPDMS